jgi:ribosomal 50S subunit-associated protein YjgA (DUF615 family)
MDSPEFKKWLFDNMPKEILNEAFEDYLKQTGALETFESWFARVPTNKELMSMIESIYHIDQHGRRSSKTFVVKLLVEEQHVSTVNNIDKLSDFIASGNLSNYKKKN